MPASRMCTGTQKDFEKGGRVKSLYTRTGDSGDTSLLKGGRVPKDDPRVEAYGTVDELNANIGLVLVESTVTIPEGKFRDFVISCLVTCQDCLMRLSAQLASGGQATEKVSDGDIAAVETAIDIAGSLTSELHHFLIPGVTRAEALMHIARTVCRRAERRVVALPQGVACPDGVRYLNRLSDLLFALARVCAAAEGRGDRIWRGGSKNETR